MNLSERVAREPINDKLIQDLYSFIRPYRSYKIQELKYENYVMNTILDKPESLGYATYILNSLFGDRGSITVNPGNGQFCPYAVLFINKVKMNESFNAINGGRAVMQVIIDFLTKYPDFCVED